jgi:hypothetical protein
MKEGGTPRRTREGIIAEVEPFLEPFRSLYIASSEFRGDPSVERTCPYCHTVIRVRPVSDSAWQPIVIAVDATTPRKVFKQRTHKT